MTEAEYRAYYESQGYTANQAKQLIFLERGEKLEVAGNLKSFFVSCKECNEERELHSCDGASTFVKMHKGHRTWVTNAGTIKAETRY